MEPASGIEGLVVIAALHVLLSGHSVFICGNRNTSHVDSRNTNCGTILRGSIVESNSSNPILAIHIGTLVKLLVCVIDACHRLIDAISTRVRKGLEPREVEDGCVITSNETLLVDDLLVVHAVRSGELPAIGGALP